MGTTKEILNIFPFSFSKKIEKKILRQAKHLRIKKNDIVKFLESPFLFGKFFKEKEILLLRQYAFTEQLEEYSRISEKKKRKILRQNPDEKYLYEYLEKVQNFIQNPKKSGREYKYVEKDIFTLFNIKILKCVLHTICMYPEALMNANHLDIVLERLRKRTPLYGEKP